MVKIYGDFFLKVLVFNTVQPCLEVLICRTGQATGIYAESACRARGPRFRERQNLPGFPLHKYCCIPQLYMGNCRYKSDILTGVTVGVPYGFFLQNRLHIKIKKGGGQWK